MNRSVVLQVPQQPPADAYTLPASAGHLPSNITLYQYEVCPFCCKVKAFLDYNKLPYHTIEVNPLTKGELSWSTYRKVPVVKFGRGKNEANSSTGGVSVEEERRWRKWVDERFVKVLTANIYRSWDESWGTFKYMTQQSHWNWAVQQSVRLAGSVLMWQIGRRMPDKYNITGGDRPNLADLSMFGVLQAIKGTDTYNDVVLHSNIGPWLSRMVLAVGNSCEIKQVPSAA
eukprot:gene12596-12728_t